MTTDVHRWGTLTQKQSDAMSDAWALFLAVQHGDMELFTVAALSVRNDYTDDDPEIDKLTERFNEYLRAKLGK